MENLDINNLNAYNKYVPYLKFGDVEYPLQTVYTLVSKIVDTDEYAKDYENYIGSNSLTTSEFMLCNYLASTGELIKRNYETDGPCGWEEDEIGFSRANDSYEFWSNLYLKLKEEMNKFNLI